MLINKVLGQLKACYKKLPVSVETRTYLKDKFYTIFAFALRDTSLYRIWYSSKYGIGDFMLSGLVQGRGSFSALQTKQPGRIAIQLHLFYLDLIDDFYAYLSNMPFAFDLLVSIVDGSKKDFVQKKFQGISTLENCIVRVVPNRGRDVAPFILGFGDVLDHYEYVAHIHSKKSLYTGTEQQKWRDYLLDNLLGSGERIQKIFAEFVHNERLGIVYPRPSVNIPYMAFTWLSNRAVGMYLLNRLQVRPNATEYFDFSAGTMFWARTKAIHRIYSSGLRLEDFPTENHQNDGTIAHAIERSLVLLAMDEGMDFYETDFATNTYTINWGSKSLWQYFNKTKEDLASVLQYETISFDIFDTLVMRRIARPELVYEILKIKILQKLGIKLDFPHLRIRAEQEVRQKLQDGSDCTLSDIYDEFAVLTGISQEVCRQIHTMEVDEEIQLCFPRMDMLEWFDACKAAGKRVVLTSDMYLESADVQRILSKCGIFGYDKLLLSSETNRRKDTAAVWDFFVEQGLCGKIIHIGDNETSDWQLAMDRGINAYHVMSSLNLFSQIPFGHNLLYKRGLNMGLWGSMVLGTILERFFNSPFVLHNGGRYSLKSFFELGYMIYGPILLSYTLWLMKETEKQGQEYILFFARDGYFLEPLYKRLTEELAVKALPSAYFLSSRRSVTTASLRTMEQIFEMLETHYEGTVQDFFLARFDLTIDLDDNRKICLPNEYDGKLMRQVIRKYSTQILDRAEQERKAYLEYISTLDVDLSKNIAVVDMGYAGTIQYYLSRLLNKDFTGYYFATSTGNRFKEQVSKRAYGCFAENEDYASTRKDIFKYQLLMEVILTSPKGQLNCFAMQDGKAVPQYGAEGGGQRYIDDLQEIHRGVQRFCDDFLEVYRDAAMDVQLDLAFMDEWMHSFVVDEQILPKELQEIYFIDDEFCNTSGDNIIEFYRHGAKK